MEIESGEWRLNCRLPIADCRLPIADCRFAIADSSVALRLNDRLSSGTVAIRPQKGAGWTRFDNRKCPLLIADSDRQSALAIVTRQSSIRESPICSLQSSVEFIH